MNNYTKYLYAIMYTLGVGVVTSVYLKTSLL